VEKRLEGWEGQERARENEEDREEGEGKHREHLRPG